MANLQLNKYFKIWHLALLTVSCNIIYCFNMITYATKKSITNWEIFKGILPPFNKKSWDEYFALYKSIPQYKELNLGMSLESFKYIFWWEYIHRLLARIVSLIFFLPLVFFLYKKHINKKNILFYILILFLFLFQGFLGWYMVKSGLRE